MAMLRPSASLYVGGLSPDVTEANLFEIFNQVGPVASIRVCRDAVTRRSLSYAYVNFHNLSDAERALDTLNYTSIKGRACRIMWSQRDPALRKSGQGNIFIKNLEKSIDNKTLHDTFSAFGNIMSCKVMVDENANSRGFGFVHFENPESADLAINQVNGMLLNEKKVYVGHHISRKERHSKYEEMKKNFTNVFVKNLDDAVDTDDKLNAAFTAYGKIISAVVMRDENNKSRGFGFVNFSTHEEAVAACDDMNEKEVNGKKLYVGRAQKKAERKEELLRKYEALRQERLSKYQGVNLFIKNLDDTIDDERLRNEFSAFGTITSAKVQADDKGLSRGFGFVCYSSPEEATKAVTEMNGRMLGTKPIYVALAQRREVRRQQLEAQYAARAQMKFAQQSGLLGPAMYGQPIFYSPMGVPPHARGQQGYVFPPPQMMANPRPRYGSSQPGGPQPQQPELMGGYLPGPNVGRTPRAPAPRNSSRPNQPPASGRVPNGVQPGQPPLANQPPRKSGNTGFRLTSTARNSRVEQPMPQQNLAPLPSGPVDLSSHLATLSTEEQKQMLGERLFHYINASQPDLAGKITGMLLEMDNAEILHLLDSPKALDEKVNEAIAVLQGSA